MKQTTKKTKVSVTRGFSGGSDSKESTCNVRGGLQFLGWEDPLEKGTAPDANNWLIWKDPDAGKHWGQEEKGTTEDEMAGWHHRLNGHEFV